jgi:hypothetical protein
MTVDSNNSNRLGKLRNVMLIAGLLSGVSSVVVQIANGNEWAIMILGWGSAFCLVASGNALVWKYALARRNHSLIRGQITLRTALLTVGLACASVGAVAALIYLYLTVFFLIGASALRLGI